jgi:drug/metabolite transporter (DMT)-like permease
MNPYLASTTAVKNHHPLLGAINVIAASLLFATASALIKAVSTELSGPMIVFFRNLFGLLFILPWVMGHAGRLRLKSDCLHLHLLRTLAGLGAMNCFYTALAYMKISEAVLLSFTSPLFIPIVAALWIREKADFRIWTAVSIGFMGVALILRPGAGVIQAVAFVGLTAGLLDGTSMVIIRRMSRTEPAARIVFYFTIMGTALSALPLPWFWSTPSTRAWLFLVLVGVMAGLGQLLLSQGYAHAPAAKVGPFYYTVVLFAGIIGWLVWDETLRWTTFLGAVLICGAGILSVYSRRTLITREPD